jgi:hypothetical protein
MAATKGNDFWKARTKHGRDKIFSDGTTFWDAACEYFQWCIDNPIVEESNMIVGIGGGASKVEKVERNKPRVFTIHGLCHFLDVNSDYITDLKDSLKDKEDEHSRDFSRLLTRAQETIYNQKFTGAAVGDFNASVMTRDLGLTDKKEVDASVKMDKAIIDWSDESTT